MSAPGRVLVTGAAGFIGSHLVDRLLDVDNVDPALLKEQEGLHSRVPLAALVSIMDAGLDEFFDQVCHDDGPSVDSRGCTEPVGGTRA